ncbi:unnamed protein product [Prorocentrum cordatum]|uniref:EF-hand domain-containing protein n=1 Tax=Prorocentrum cordatum TaxID=2364126 RepID=A0ABN9XTI1_9DINO|nr:unnamed protein product [Polarella glacialis]
MVLVEAMQLKYFASYPCEPGGWKAYVRHHTISQWAYVAVACLLVLSVFEVPAWCSSSVWDWRPLNERCVMHSSAQRELVVSGVPVLPIGCGLAVEYVMYAILATKQCTLWKLQSLFRQQGADYCNPSWLLFEGLMVLIGILDLVVATFCHGVAFRAAPFVRCGLAASSPLVQHLVETFYEILLAISKVGLFLSGTIVVFAWAAALLFNDITERVSAGPVNTGFATFSDALYTSFVAGTTANLPDAMVPTYEYFRVNALLWLVFLIFAVVIFLQVVLAVVYNQYTDVKTRSLKEDYGNRDKGIDQAFELLKIEQYSANPNEPAEAVVPYNVFEEVVLCMKSCDRSLNMEASTLRFVYDALDDDENGVVTYKEFTEMCDDESELEKQEQEQEQDHPFEDTWLMKSIGRLVTNRKDGPDLGYMDRSRLDILSQGILGTNVLFIVMESVYDLHNIPEPTYFNYVENAFSVVYLLDVGLKLCWWSLPEFWHHTDNQVDLVTTLLLAGAGIGVMFLSVDRSLLRPLNMLRMVRLFKALAQVEAFKETCGIIARMVATCKDVLLMNVLVIYLWSSCGVLLFGGELYSENPRFEAAGVDAQDLDYFSSHFQVYSFNDVPLSFVTLFFFTICGWVDQVVVACLSLSPSWTPYWAATHFFMVSFYIASPLITFNLLSAFAIDVYCKLEEYAESESKGESSEVYQNIKDIQEDMSKQGLCLHVAMSAALKRAQVYRDMFPQDGEDEKEAGQKDGDGGDEAGSEQEKAKLALGRPPAAKAIAADSLDGDWRTGSSERVRIRRSKARFSKESWALRVRGSDSITAIAAEGEKYEATLVNGELHWDDDDVWVRDDQARGSSDEEDDGDRRDCTGDCSLM